MTGATRMQRRPRGHRRHPQVHCEVGSPGKGGALWVVPPRGMSDRSMDPVHLYPLCLWPRPRGGSRLRQLRPGFADLCGGLFSNNCRPRGLGCAAKRADVAQGPEASLDAEPSALVRVRERTACGCRAAREAADESLRDRCGCHIVVHNGAPSSPKGLARPCRLPKSSGPSRRG
jgi:hypothetical protein